MYHCNRFYKIKINTLVQDLVRLLMNARTCCAVAWTPSHFMPSLHVVALPTEATEMAAFRAAAVWIRKEDDAAAQSSACVPTRFFSRECQAHSPGVSEDSVGLDEHVDHRKHEIAHQKHHEDRHCV